jgi:hypothetical protein
LGRWDEDRIHRIRHATHATHLPEVAFVVPIENSLIILITSHLGVSAFPRVPFGPSIPGIHHRGSLERRPSYLPSTRFPRQAMSFRGSRRAHQVVRQDSYRDAFVSLLYIALGSLLSRQRSGSNRNRGSPCLCGDYLGGATVLIKISVFWVSSFDVIMMILGLPSTCVRKTAEGIPRREVSRTSIFPLSCSL